MFSFPHLSDFFNKFQQPIVILDFETTGGDFYQDRVTEIAFLHFYQGKVQSFSHLVQPKQTISPFVAKLTGISDEMLADAPLFGEIWTTIEPLLRGSIIIAHNSQFDYAFLRHETHREQIAFAAHTLCSVKLSRRLYPMFHKHSLDAIIERHHLKTQSRHRAMSDVVNLAQFLQLALSEQGEQALFEAMQSLIYPKLLPEHIALSFREDLNRLSDDFGVSAWHNHQGEIVALHTHEKTFSECVIHLHQHPSLAQNTKQITFYPAIGALHAYAIKAQLVHHHQLLPREQTGRHTIVFTQDTDGCLKARVRELKAGFQAAAPTGLFLNSKAAKRALQEWAKAHHICPTQLGILPNELPKNAPCPARLVHGCTASCQNQDSLAHNLAVQAALPFLPNSDWGKQAQRTFREYDWTNAQEMNFLAQCGALHCASLGWYIERGLLDTFKRKRKAEQSTHQKAA